MSKKRQSFHTDEPLRHPDHPRPVTRREFIRQGFLTGGAVVTGSSLLNLFLHPEQAHALSADVSAMVDSTCLSAAGGSIPFICFDLAGGANIAGSNVLVGKQGGQRDNIDATGFSRLGIPASRIPGLTDASGRGNGDFTNNELGLYFHSESPLLAGILSKLAVGGRTNVNGAVIPARSENDTGNNPHNPLYGIAKAGAKGKVANLIGSVNSVSGANSQSPAMLIIPEERPVKVDRPSDVVGLVPPPPPTVVGAISGADTVKVMESVARISEMKLGSITTGTAPMDAQIKPLVRCGYVKAADIAETSSTLGAVDPSLDPEIVGTGGIFSAAEFTADSEFRKTASVMKMVLGGAIQLSGAGSITMGGYDYHTGDRITGERRDLRAGKCIGAVLEYARRKGKAVMIYVYSDGSVFSNGMLDNTTLTDTGTGTTITLPGGKGQWTGDSSTTASSFFLVYNPTGRPVVKGATAAEQARHQQLGWFRPTAAVETTASTPGAGNVNQLVEMVLLNYLALSNRTGEFATLFPGHGIGAASGFDNLIAFNSLT